MTANIILNINEVSIEDRKVKGQKSKLIQIYIVLGSSQNKVVFIRPSSP